MNQYDNIFYIYKHVLKNGSRLKQGFWWRLKGRTTGKYKVKLTNIELVSEKITFNVMVVLGGNKNPIACNVRHGG